jgi:nucleoid-associated protein YgaU
MTSRYDNKEAVKNQSELYKSFFKKRGIKFINQFRTGKLSFPSNKETSTIKQIDHIWRAGDKYYKLAQKFYNDPSLWWIIAWYNMKPTEGHVHPGQVISIPLPLDRVLAIFMRNK